MKAKKRPPSLSSLGARQRRVYDAIASVLGKRVSGSKPIHLGHDGWGVGSYAPDLKPWVAKTGMACAVGGGLPVQGSS